jgi:hypothetical protein
LLYHNCQQKWINNLLFSYLSRKSYGILLSYFSGFFLFFPWYTPFN